MRWARCVHLMHVPGAGHALPGRRVSEPARRHRLRFGRSRCCPSGRAGRDPGRLARGGERPARCRRPTPLLRRPRPARRHHHGLRSGIAETGTTVLDGGLDQGRRALSLLPDLHVCVVMVSQVVGSVPEALARLVADPTPNVDQRTIRHQRHRTPAGRGRPRPPSSGRHRRQGVAARPPRAASAYHSCP